MRLSDNGARLIAEFEGFRSRPYRDAVGVWTIGYGSTRGVGPNTPAISKTQALGRLKAEVTSTYGRAVDRLRLPLNQNQYDALCSFTYNLGPGILGPDRTIGRLLRQKRFKDAADAMLLYDKAGGRRLEGLTRRRRAERALFLKPVSIPSPRHERRIISRIDHHRRAALRAPAGSARKRKHAAWREFWKVRARAQMVKLQADARARKGGWAEDNRGTRYQRLRSAVLNK